MKRIKFFVYTILFGLIPFSIRMFLFLVIQGIEPDYYFNVVDVVTFGLMILTGSFAEIDVQTGIKKEYKTLIKGLFTLAIIIQSSCLGISYLSELLSTSKINTEALRWYSLITAIFSLILSASLFFHPNFEDDEI